MNGCRTKWDMPHKSAIDYDRDKEKKIYDDYYDDQEYIIYCDMDGTICSFAGPALERMNYYRIHQFELSPKQRKLLKKCGNIEEFKLEHILPWDKKNNKYVDYMFSLIRKDISFWEHLPWIEESKELWNYIKQYNPYILTGPLDEASEEGKKRWCERELGISRDRVIVTQDKFKYAKENTILIDDFLSYLQPFRDNGGIGILHRNTKHTIKQLKIILDIT